MSNAGRPKTNIEKEQFEKLCSMQATVQEIAGFFDCSHDTIERWVKQEYGKTFADVFKSKRVGGLLSLRRSQFKLAEKNAAMAIWLGKQYLAQKDIITFNNLEEVEDDPLTASIKANIARKRNEVEED